MRVDNFATFNGTKVCIMSKVSKFCLEKKRTCISMNLDICCLLHINILYPFAERLLKGR